MCTVKNVIRMFAYVAYNTLIKCESRDKTSKGQDECPVYIIIDHFLCAQVHVLDMVPLGTLHIVISN